MMKAIICVGISASGKSTFAHSWVNSADQIALGAPRSEINRDAIRKELVEISGKEWCWDNWKWSREKEVTVIANELISYAALHKHDVIISDTNLDANRRGKLMEQLEELGYVVELKDFSVTWEEAVKRDNARANGVGHSVIAKQYGEWLEYIGRKKYVPDTTKPKCILCDLDGTLFHMDGKRGAFEWTKVGQDRVDDAVKQIINALSMTTNMDIIMLSGRDSVCRVETLHSLRNNMVVFHKLFMRAEGDMRKDTVIKEELFWNHIADNYAVQFVFDDRPVVARFWRELGLKVFQVGDPHIEF
jgi:predicted kinase